MNQNGHSDHVAVVDSVDEHAPTDEKHTAYYDPSNPVLKPAKEVEPRKKSWKRKLVSWSLMLMVIACAAIALYLLLKVNRVNVKVDAESRRENQNLKPKTETKSEDFLTDEAIKRAREALGADNPRFQDVQTTPSPSVSPTPTPSPSLGTNYRFTGNSSPVWEQLNDGSKGDGNQQQTDRSQQGNKVSDSSTPTQMQNHANATNSIFVDDSISVSLQTIKPSQVSSRSENRSALSAASKTLPAILPPFGTMLPVRTQGVIFTLRNNSYARFELTRDSEGGGWSLPKGTVFIGRTTGNEYDRAFINVIGYIDPRDNKLVKMTGDVLGIDGAAGIPGKRMGVDRNRLKETLRKVASSGFQVAGMMSGALGRGTVILDRSGYSIPYDINGRGTQDQKNAFVKVEAGQSGYVMVVDLPKSIPAIDAPGDDELIRAAKSLSDREVMELILFGSPDEIRAAMPLMTEEQRKLANKSIQKENQEK